MITIKEAMGILKYSEEYVIIDVQLMPPGFIRGCLLNDIDPRRPFRIIVHPVIEDKKPSMRIWISSVIKMKSKAVLKALERTRRSLTWGYVAIDSRGAVSFRFWEDMDISAEQLVILLDKMVESVQLFEMTLSFYSMLDSGISRNHVKTIMKTYFPKWKTIADRLRR